MANNYTDIIPKLFKMALPRLRGRFTMPRYVRTDISPDPTEKGQTVNIKLPVEGPEEGDFTPTFNPSLSDTSQKTVPITLDQHKKASFNLTDKEVGEIMDGVAPSGMNAAIDELAKGANKRLFSLYKQVYQYHAETDGSNNIIHPFQSDISSIAEVDRQLFEQNVDDNRALVLNGWARHYLFQRDQFNDASIDPQNAQNFREARLGNKLGFGIDADTQAPKHTAGSGVSGDPTVTSDTDAGATTVNVTCDSDDSVDVVEGDIIQFAGDSYAVKSAQTINSSNSGNIELYQPLRADLSSGDSVATPDNFGSHSVNLAFGRNAFGLAVRVPQQPAFADAEGGIVLASEVMRDPVSRIPMRMQILRGLGVTQVVFDVLYGYGKLREEEAVRLGGAV